MVTHLTTTAGKRQKCVTSIERVRRHDGAFVVDYTAKILVPDTQAIRKTEKSIRLIDPVSGICTRVNEYPVWLPDASEVHLQQIKNGTEAERYHLGDGGVAFVLTDSFWDNTGSLISQSGLMIPYTGHGQERASYFRFGPRLEVYRERWGYPVCIVGTPLAILFDAVTLPIQWIVITLQLNQVH
jgi:hypothetical protein